ncbi:MAG: GNAT family N-acetyltransferase [Cutibacterium acnes]|nr:GNAT family N-acetyltransferase [Cutibacterium acnes]
MIQESWEFSLSWHRSEITEIMAGHLRSALLIPIAAGVEAAIIWARHGLMLMCVHAVPRTQGHGSQILTQVCQWADEHGLTLELKPSGPAAERFYKRFGFVKTSRRVMRRECLSGRADPHKGV